MRWSQALYWQGSLWISDRCSESRCALAAATGLPWQGSSLRKMPLGPGGAPNLGRVSMGATTVERLDEAG